MTKWRVWPVGLVLCLPAFLLAASGAIHLHNGLALDAAFPVPLNLSGNIALPLAAYIDAAEVLRNADIHDGNTQVSLAEARFDAGEKPRSLLKQLEGGLIWTPASAEGWAFYAEMLANSDPTRAGLALDQAFTLAPYDYFWAQPRAQLASHIWNDLNGETKVEALRQARLLWEEPNLREELMPLLSTSDGARLITRAYASNPDAIRDINRWVSARLRQMQSDKIQRNG